MVANKTIYLGEKTIYRHLNYEPAGKSVNIKLSWIQSKYQVTKIWECNSCSYPDWDYAITTDLIDQVMSA